MLILWRDTSILILVSDNRIIYNYIMIYNPHLPSNFLSLTYVLIIFILNEYLSTFMDIVGLFYNHKHMIMIVYETCDLLMSCSC